MGQGTGIAADDATAAEGGGAPRWAAAAVRAAVLAAIFLVLWLWVRPGFVYYRITPPFPVYRLGARFAADFLPHPGGPVDYAAACLSQFFLWHWAGALITVGLAAALAAALWLFLRTAFGVRPAWLHLAPLVLVPLLLARYANHLNGLIAVLVAVAAASLWATAGRRHSVLGATLFAVVAVLVYYLGCGAVLLFALLCALTELRRRRLAWTAAFLLLGGLLPYAIGVVVLHERPVDAYERLLPMHRYAEPIAAGLMAALWVYLAAAAAWCAARPTATGRQWPMAARWSAVGVLAAAAVLAGTNRPYGRVLSLDYYVRHGMWADVLTTAPRIERKRYNLIVALTVNLALAHTGRLNDDMLAYHPTPQSLIRTPEEFLPPVGRPYDGPTPLAFMRLGDIYYDLGRVNEAEQMACEALEAQGDRPWLVERLAVINLTKEKWAAASRYIDLLVLDPVHRRRARQLQALVHDKGAAAHDPEIARLRALRPVGPERGPRALEGMLVESIRRSPTNEMAVQYLMAHCLLTANLPGVAANVGRLAALRDGRVPKLCEEALAIYGEVHGTDAGFDSRLVSDETRARLAAFARAVSAAGGDPVKARLRLAPKYGDSYLLYYAVNAMSEEE